MRRTYPSSVFRALAFVAALLAFAVPRAAFADDRARLIAQLHGFAHPQSFRMHVVETSPAGTSTKDVSYVAPDKVRLVLGNTGLVVVVIGDNVWLRRIDGSWQKAHLPAAQSPLGTVRDAISFADRLPYVRVTALGRRTLYGIPTDLYKLDTRKSSGYSIKTSRLWIAIGGYPVKLEERNGPYLATTTYADWNRPFDVSAP
jgi:hypothetical protein